MIIKIVFNHFKAKKDLKFIFSIENELLSKIVSTPFYKS